MTYTLKMKLPLDETWSKVGGKYTTLRGVVYSIWNQGSHLTDKELNKCFKIQSTSENWGEFDFSFAMYLMARGYK